MPKWMGIVPRIRKGSKYVELFQEIEEFLRDGADEEAIYLSNLTIGQATSLRARIANKYPNQLIASCRQNKFLPPECIKANRLQGDATVIIMRKNRG